MEAGAISSSNKGDDCSDLPPGFRFHPTDEEIITCYLKEKIINTNFNPRAIGEADLNKSEPWDLPKKAKMGEKEWYFFCQRDRKYPTGMRTNRATEAGYWKATGKDKEIYKAKNCLVGMKKTLVFYRGRAPKGTKTNWVMHEYRLEGKASYYNHPKPAKDEWVVCRIFHKSSGAKKSSFSSLMRLNSLGDDLFDSSVNSLPSLSSMDDFGPNSSFSYLPTSMDHHLEQRNNMMSNYQSAANPSYTTPPNTNNSNHFYPQVPVHLNPLYSFKQGFSNSGFGHQGRTTTSSVVLPPFQNSAGFSTYHPDQAILRAMANTQGRNNNGSMRECKMEQYSSNQSVGVSLSQDTGLSTDRNPEISSVNVSKRHDLGSSINKPNDQDLEGPSSSTVPVFDYDCLW